MNFIPARIADAGIYRQVATRRIDGSVLVVRCPSLAGTSDTLVHEELITANRAFVSEPNFSRLPVQRSLRCLEGELYACLVDVRVGSPTAGRWQSFCLAEGDGRTLIVPAGVACGWQVLSEVATLERRYDRDFQGSRWQWLRWNDPELGISWPYCPSQLENHLRRSRHLSAVPEHRLPDYRPLAMAASSADFVPPSPLDESQLPGASSPVGDAGRRTNSRVSDACDSRRKPLILVIGSSGQLGRDLCRHLRRLGTVVGACRNPDKGSLLPVPVLVDISRPASLRQAIRHIRPKLIVNAAGLSDIEAAENNPRLAQLVNATAPAIIAEEAKRIDAGLIHFCSSMVFDGSGERPWRESDMPLPQNQFARTKLLGTQAVAACGVPHMILRVGWLYSTHGDNFVRRLIDSLCYRSTVTLASDHCGSPTSTDWLTRTIADLLDRADGQFYDWLSGHGGLYHVAPLGYANRLEVGDQILATCRQYGLPTVLQNLQGLLLAELSSHATIPPNCRLDPTYLAMKFALELPRWQVELKQQIAAMLGEHTLNLHGVA